jgi:hypothetical protein
MTGGICRMYRMHKIGGAEILSILFILSIGAGAGEVDGGGCI